MSEFQDFVEQLQDWHERQVASLKTISETKVEIIKLGTDENALELSGREARVFRMGVSVALQYLGKLPFSVQHEDGE